MSSSQGGERAPSPAPSSDSFQATMAKAGEQARRRSPAMFLLIGLCFFLPFVSLSCSGQRIATLSGVQLVTGAEVDIDDEALREQLGEFGAGAETEEPPPSTEENDPSIFAIVALAGAVLGVIVGFVVRGRARSTTSLAAALLGLAGLIGLRFDLESDVSEAEGLVSVDYRLGYWIAALLFVVLAIAHGMFLRANRANAPPPGPGP